VSQGVRYIQLDAPFYSHYLDPRHREAMRQSGGDPDADFEAAAAGDNAAMAGVARENVTLAVHICRGNSRSPSDRPTRYWVWTGIASPASRISTPPHPLEYLFSASDLEALSHDGSRNHAFGDATLTWDDALVNGGEALESVESAIAWLRVGQKRLRQSVTALSDDADLAHPRMTNWGEWKDTRWIIATLIQHDLYHAGEINHLRSLRQGTDQWEYERE
jgi:hypothetical protein